MNRAGSCAALLFLSVAACGEWLRADPLAAARADSSAAGYTVGLGTGESGTTPPARGPAVPEVASARPRAPRAPRATPEPPTATSAAVTVPPRQQQRAPEPPLANPPPREEIKYSELPDSMIIGDYVWFEPPIRVLHLRLEAGLGAPNEGLNFNGEAAGSAVVKIPYGLLTNVDFVNRDAERTHSAIVIPWTDPLPPIPPGAAFPRAFTSRLTEGHFEGGVDSFSFRAAAPGRYMIVCGTPGHAQAGMWIAVEVVPEGTLPSYESP